MLWAFWMTPRRSTGETPYSMTYGSEAVITIEVRMKNLPNQQKKKKKNNNNNLALSESLDMVEGNKSP